jgi:gamma-glutamyltranspeptidase/glutathione hydrolase
MLNTIENENIGALGFNSVRTIWLMTEAMRFAYADRAEWMGDPDFSDVPVAALTSKDYGKDIYNEIIAYGFKARPSADPLFVNGGLLKNKMGLTSPAGGVPGEGNETTHYSVIDKWGNAVGITFTINMGYGCKAAVDGAGFFMNNEMDDFMSLPGQPNGFGLIQGEANCVGPKKRPLSSMSPTIVLSSDNSVFLVTGSPGGSQIINTVLHTVVNAIDHGMNVSEMTAAPRFHMQWMPDRLQYEALFGFTNDTIKILSNDLGYNLAASSQGDVSAIMRNPATGAVTGINDPRTYDIPPSISFDELMDYVDSLP